MKKFISILLMLVLVLSHTTVYANEISVVDSTKRTVELANVPQRVVVLGYPEYDTLRALKLESIIVGAPKANAPKYIGEISNEVTDIGSVKEPNLEVIAELSPDLIIATGRTEAFVPELEKIAPVYVSMLDTTNYWESFVTNIESLATIFNVSELASEQITEIEKLVTSLKANQDALQASTLALMLNEGNLSVFSSHSRFAPIYQILAMQPVDMEIEDARHGQEISFEGILALNPQRIYYIDRSAAIGGDVSKNNALLTNELIAQTDAMKNNQVHALTSDLWYIGGGGLESLRLQLEELATTLAQ